jgi:hypothetical protein
LNLSIGVSSVNKTRSKWGLYKTKEIPRQDQDKTEKRTDNSKERDLENSQDTPVKTFMAYQWNIDAILILLTSIFNWDSLWPSVCFLTFLRFLSIDKRSLHFKTKACLGSVKSPMLSLNISSTLVSQSVMKTTLNLIKLNILTFGTTVVNRCNWLRNFVLDRIKKTKPSEWMNEPYHRPSVKEIFITISYFAFLHRRKSEQPI